MLTDAPSLTCPVAGTDDVSLFLEIPDVPVLCNVLSPTREAARAMPRGTLQLGFCGTSGHIFNYAFDAERLTYSQAYENSLHFSPRFQSYAEGLADDLVARHGLRGKRIVELGCGKGDFLRMLCARGDNEGLGFDPSYEPDLVADEDRRFTVVQDLYSERYAHHDADLLCCRHVLEHIEAPRAFLSMVRRALGDRPDTAVFFEVPNMAYTLREEAIWDLIYEHCSFFTPASLAFLFRNAGFDVTRVAPAFGDQYVTIEAYPAPGPVPHPAEHPATVAALADAVAAFASRFEEKRSIWQDTLDALVRDGQRVVVWGAGSKGVTILNLVHAGGGVASVVDINPRKQGMYVAGTGQEIVAPEALRAQPPDVVVAMNPLYTEEIGATLAGLGLSPRLLVA